jgi:ADP-heptose:LPS heptosyltransferase
MISLIILKIKNLIVFIISYLLISLIQLRNVAKTPKSLLLIRLDEIGDFILFCNFITEVKSSKKYRNFKISLCGNEIWKNLAENFFNADIDQFIWMNKNKFYSNPFYKFKILKEIYQSGFEVVINSRYSRGILYDDLIVKASSASISIGSQGSLEKHAKWKRHLFTDHYYTQLIPQTSEVTFEFIRNIYFFKKILGEPLETDKPTLIPLKKISSDLPKKYITLFAGVSETKRMWHINNFIEIIQFILEKHKFPVVLCGSAGEIDASQTIMHSLSNDRVSDLTGKTSLSDLVSILAKSKLLISNETSAPHFAAAVNTPFICISMGKGFGRFFPYPPEIYDKAHYIYPPTIMKNLDKIEKLKDQLQFDSDLDINEIDVEQVKRLIDKCLGNQT